MKILIIGGTRFLGRHLVDIALARGHKLTLFNRGKTNPNLYPEVETILGDRDGGLDAFTSRQWDAVIDTCGYYPRVVRASAQALAGLTPHYTFISSISVYPDDAGPNVDESAPVGTIDDESVEEITGETYGPLKALCEQAVQAAFPDGALIIRPGLIVGPHDSSDRFTYWPARLSRGGNVLAPGDPQMPVQIIDVRDLAEWNIRLVENQVTGVFNATGPVRPLTMDEILETCQQVAGVASEFAWVDEEFLLEQEVAPYTELPLWVPKEYWWMSQVSISLALDSGLKFRSLTETVADTQAWERTRAEDYDWLNGLKPEREVELLGAWQKEKN